MRKKYTILEENKKMCSEAKNIKNGYLGAQKKQLYKHWKMQRDQKIPNIPKTFIKQVKATAGAGGAGAGAGGGDGDDLYRNQ